MLCEKGVRQGCPLSPILFDIYISDLLNNLTPHKPKCSETDKWTYLACADDIIIISHSALGLQASLETVQTTLLHLPIAQKLLIFSQLKRHPCILMSSNLKQSQLWRTFWPGKVNDFWAICMCSRLCATVQNQLFRILAKIYISTNIIGLNFFLSKSLI